MVHLIPFNPGSTSPFSQLATPMMNEKTSSYMVAMAQKVPFFFWIQTLYDNTTTRFGWCTKTDPAKTCTQAPSWHPTTVTWRPPWSTWRSWHSIAGAGWTGTTACRGRSSLERRPGRSPLEPRRSSSAPWILELESHSGSENWGISMMFGKLGITESFFCSGWIHFFW